MSTTIATLEYRTFVPSGWIATEFCRLSVMGVSDKEVKTLEDAWHDIEFEKYREKEILINGLEQEKEKLEFEQAQKAEEEKNAQEQTSGFDAFAELERNKE